MRSMLLIACLTSACAPNPLPLPMTAGAAADDSSGGALIAYLSQPDATADFCAVAASGPHVHEWSPAMRGAFVDGLRDGRIKPAPWKRCAKQLVDHLGADDRAALLDAALGAYGELLHDKLDTDPVATERASTLQRFYLDRTPGTDAHAGAVTALTSMLRDALADKKLGRVATQLGQEMLDTFDIEHGTWHGSAVSIAEMDRLASTGNELTLRRFADRLPNEELRAEASRRLVRIHIALSPFPEVKRGGGALEAKVVATGVDAVDLAKHPVEKLWFDADHVPVRDVVVRQHVWQRTATLLAAGAKLRVVPEIPLQGALLAQLTGISRPVTVCGSAKDLDPSPCIAASAISIDRPLVSLDGNKLHIVDELQAPDLLPLTEQDTFVVAAHVGKAPAASFAWGLHFERPEDLLFRAAIPGSRGPDLTVRVAAPRADRASFDVNYRGVDYLAFVEQSDLASYRVGSQGGSGRSGSEGANGMAGSPGTECSNGSSGGRGEDGGDGGNGGTGGNITVQMACVDGGCGAIASLVRGSIVSLGGSGGWGGSGGHGGQGGAGGSGRAATTHIGSDGIPVTDDPGCSAGMAGSSGIDGMAGANGSPGHPGRVTF